MEIRLNLSWNWYCSASIYPKTVHLLIQTLNRLSMVLSLARTVPGFHHPSSLPAQCARRQRSSPLSSFSPPSYSPSRHHPRHHHSFSSLLLWLAPSRATTRLGYPHAQPRAMSQSIIQMSPPQVPPRDASCCFPTQASPYSLVYA